MILTEKTEVPGEKYVPVPHCPPKSSHGLTWDKTRASATTGRPLNAWPMDGYDDSVMRMQRVGERCRVLDMIEWTSRKIISPVGPAYQRQLKELLLDLHTGRPLTESNYTRCCINTIDLLIMSTCLLETCRGLKYTYYIKELYVKLVTYQKLCCKKMLFKWDTKRLVPLKTVNGKFCGWISVRALKASVAVRTGCELHRCFVRATSTC